MDPIFIPILGCQTQPKITLEGHSCEYPTNGSNAMWICIVSKQPYHTAMKIDKEKEMDIYLINLKFSFTVLQFHYYQWHTFVKHGHTHPHYIIKGILLYI